MKRSEMIDKIFEPFKSNYEDDIPVVITPLVIDHILQIVEDAGMLPPNTRKTSSIEYEYGIDWVEDNYVWEPEDE